MKLSVGEGFQDKLSNFMSGQLVSLASTLLRILIYTCLIQILF